MRKITLLLVILCVMVANQVFAQDTLVVDENQFVNTQVLDNANITVFKLERSKVYAFDGRLDINRRVEIIGPDNGPIIKDNAEGHPPVLVNTPDASTGASRQFVKVGEGGALVLQNLIVSGVVATGNPPTRVVVENDGGSEFTFHNVVFADWEDFCIRNRTKDVDISVTDCVFINGVRYRYSQWGGMPMRLDASGNSVTIENNTIVNSGRLLANAGPFLNSNMTVLHNTMVNSSKNAIEMRQFSFLGANNIFYNWEMCGFGPDQLRTSDYYQMHFTTGMEFSPVSNNLDSISSYLGQNAFFREQALVDWFASRPAEDSLFVSNYWEFVNVDSFVTVDDDFKIGTNYEGFDPMFAMHPGNSDDVLAWVSELWYPDTRPVPDRFWGIVSPVTFDPSTSAPVVEWPPAFDLSYSDATLLSGGSDGLPLGDLNWFPAEKETYLANRDAYIAALKDSMNNATGIYVPGSPTPFITPGTTSVDDDNAATPDGFALAQNYPNPFNPTTNISFTVPTSGKVKLAVYNLIGQVVATLVDEHRTAGNHSITFEAANLPSGVYFYRLEMGNTSMSKKLMLLK